MVISIEKMILYRSMINLMPMNTIDFIQWKNIQRVQHGMDLNVRTFSKRRTSEWLKLSRSIVIIL